ncbi:MAG: polyprenyl synthetase family protein [Silicimonas sp.]|nr:polyprenyl synthetase family protein [Silicimonas sp.]
MSFADDLAGDAARIGAVLDAELARLPAGVIRDGMRYASNGGKRLRGFLVLRSARLHGADEAGALLAAAAIEAMHAYSLVHDDLPSMDDDDLRRGQPTVHRKWDEATAVLVGDALQTFAFDLLSREAVHPDASVRVALIASMAKAAGAEGMVLGQALDIAAETADEPLTLPEIEHLQAGKTGALIEWSCAAGAHLGGADPAPMTRYASAIGRAFQIADDILDVTGDEAKAGKRLQKDEGAGKATFVSLLGLEGAKTRARDLVAQALHELAPYDKEADPLREAAGFVISRDF